MNPPSLLPSGTIRPRRRLVKPLGLGREAIHQPAVEPPKVEAVLLTASGWHWVVQLRGEIEAVIEYDARRPGVELVKVDSRVVCRAGTLGGYNGRFVFTLPGDYRATRVELEVSNSLWSAVTAFRLSLEGEIVFACETSVETCSLPVPARSPASDRAELPLPHTRRQS